MKINAIYSTYQGEVNVRGIGAPVIFVRTQGCHIRCYKKTLGVLCDTIEALEINESEKSREMSISDVLKELDSIYEKTGIDLICLSGGDPLYRDSAEIHSFLDAVERKGYVVSIETSGTLSIKNYLGRPNVYWVLDYKLKSAGIKPKFVYEDLRDLTPHDIIKFVVYDETDYEEFLGIVENLQRSTLAKIAIGVYWGGKTTNEQLVKWLTQDRLIGKVHINFQVHKLATLADNTPKEQYEQLQIPKEL